MGERCPACVAAVACLELSLKMTAKGLRRAELSKLRIAHSKAWGEYAKAQHSAGCANQERPCGCHDSYPQFHGQLVNHGPGCPNQERR